MTVQKGLMIVLKTADVQGYFRNYVHDKLQLHTYAHTHTERKITIHLSAEIPTNFLTDVTCPIRDIQGKKLCAL
jgi:ribosome-associated translation inhibitor RaiA